MAATSLFLGGCHRSIRDLGKKAFNRKGRKERKRKERKENKQLSIMGIHQEQNREARLPTNYNPFSL